MTLSRSMQIGCSRLSCAPCTYRAAEGRACCQARLWRKGWHRARAASRSAAFFRLGSTASYAISMTSSKGRATKLRGTVLQHHLHACGVLALECRSTLAVHACLSRPKGGIETRGGGQPWRQDQSSLLWDWVFSLHGADAAAPRLASARLRPCWQDSPQVYACTPHGSALRACGQGYATLERLPKRHLWAKKTTPVGTKMGKTNNT